jgi:hypothetical protein
MPSFTIASTATGIYQFDPIDSNGNVIVLTEVEKAAVDRPDLLSVQTVSGTQFKITAKGKVGTANVTIVGKNESGQPISTTFQFTITAPAAPVQATGFKGTQIS